MTQDPTQQGREALHARDKAKYIEQWSDSTMPITAEESAAYDAGHEDGHASRQPEIEALRQKLVDSIAETLSAQEAANNNAGIAMKAGCREGLRVFAAITKNRNHPPHSVRYSDSSAYDEKCEQCGATDADHASLDKPCPTPIASHE